MSLPSPIKAVAIGGSAGSVATLLEILKELPATFRPSIFVTVHVPPNAGRSTLAEILRTHCQVAVIEAEDKEPVKEGTVYIAPANYHLLVEASGSLALSTEEPVLFSRPSIDVLFESAADAYGAALLGVVLSGANEDGARGLAAIGQAGGATVVQEPSTAYAAAMPLAALKLCPGAQAASPQQIVTHLKQL